MAVTHRTVVEGVLAAAILLIASVPSARAEHAPRAHVRTWDVPAQRLVRYALRQSPLTRQLAERLQRSDVFVYVGYDCELPESLMGRLSFMAFAPGVRYVSVHLSCKAPLLVQLAALGHELRHAVEIAEDHSVVDDASLLDSYRRIGFQSRTRMPSMVSYDTQAAIDAGAQVWRELRGHGAARFDRPSAGLAEVNGSTVNAD